MPHSNEEELVSKIAEAKNGGPQAWKEFVEKIRHVKEQVMEHLEDNEEARMMAAELFLDNALTGEFMDPEGEQEREDNRLETFEQCSEFEYIDPESLANVDSDTFDQSFKAIEVRPLKELCSEAKKLDFYQRKVVPIGVKHARSLVKARNG